LDVNLALMQVYHRLSGLPWVVVLCGARENDLS
jgi:hypothetical protein